MSAQTVADVMSPDVVTVCEEDSLAEVAEILADANFRHIPVVDGKTVVGIVTQRNLLLYTVSRLEVGAAANTKGQDLLAQTFVAKVMIRDPETVLPETPVAVAAAKLVKGHFDCLPVVDAKNELIGIVTTYDLLAILAAS